jgi:hypothetical protein
LFLSLPLPLPLLLPLLLLLQPACAFDAGSSTGAACNTTK